MTERNMERLQLFRQRLQQTAGQPEKLQKRCQISRAAAEEFPFMPEFRAEYAAVQATYFRYAAAVREMQSALALPLPETSLFLQPVRRQAVRMLQRWQALADQAAALRVTACLIVRDEAERIRDWLRNVRIYSDAVVVVDTGSVDATRQILQRAGITVHGVPWQDHFAAARNAALAQVSGGWIVFLDADEGFMHPQCIRGFLAQLSACQPGMEAVMLPVVSIDEDQGGREMQQRLNLRIFRSTPELRYYGRVHEILQQEDGHPVRTAVADQRLCVRHTGYSLSRVVQKNQRNLALLQKEIAEIGMQPRHYYYLANSYFILQDYEQALYYAELSMRYPVHMIGGEEDAHCWAEASRAMLAKR